MMSAAQIVAALLGRSSYYPSGAEVGLGSSTRPIRVNDGQSQQILNVRLPDILPSGCDGMATIHLTTTEHVPVTPIAGANSKLLVSASWQSGRGGGDVEVDGSEGMILTVAANTSVQLNGRLVPAVEGAILNVGSTYTCEAVVKWYTSSGGGPARLALPSRPIVAGVTTFFKIPALARNVTLHAVNNAAYATLHADLATSPAVGAIRYSTPNNPDRWPIVNGVEWLRIVASVDTPAFPSFELWC